MKENFIKGLTLLIFISLIVAYVTYRSGFFGSKKRSNPINDTESNHLKDSVPKFDLPGKTEFIPSSKSGIISLPISKLELDSMREKKARIDSFKKELKMMPGSKSFLVIPPDEVKKLLPDSSRQDTTKIEWHVDF